MALEAIGNCGGMLDRSIAAYLISQGCGTWANILSSDSLQIKGYPNATILSHQSVQDEVLTGNERWQVTITAKYSAVQSVNAPDKYAARVARDQFVGLITAAMLQSDDGATLDATAAMITAAGRALATTGTPQQQADNADLVNFTCLHVHFLGSTRGIPDEEGCAWVEVRRFEIVAAPTALE